MLRYLQHTVFAGLCAFVAFAALMSCSANDEAESNAADHNRVNVVFSIAMQESSTTTRADVDWSSYSPSDIGTEQESNVNLETLQVGIYDSRNNLLGQVGRLAAQRVPNADGTTAYYRVQGSWQPTDEAQLQAAKKVMVIANAPTTATLTTDLGALQFTTAETGTTTANLTYIPMWGVTEIASTLELGKSTDLGEVYLLRSMAKVLVGLTTEMMAQGYSIESVQLNNHNEQGYIVPQGYQGVSSTRALTFANTPHYLASLNAAALDFSLPAAAATRQYSQNLYVPEYENAAATATPSTLTVKLALNGTTEGTYTFGFYEYTADGKAQTTKPVDIVRNHFYLFSLYKSSTMKVNLSVRPWRKLTHDTVVM